MECWAYEKCSLNWKDTDRCGERCQYYILMNIAYTRSNMPIKYQYDYKNKLKKGYNKDSMEYIFDYMDNIKENVESGKGLYLYGNVATGKTTLACRILNSYIQNRKRLYDNIVKDNDESYCMGVYIEVSKFLEDYRNNYSNQDEEFEQLLYNVFNSPLVIFDDIGVEKVSEWTMNRLYDIINYRINNNLCNIFTSNKSIDDIRNTLGDRIASRIGRCAIPVYFKGEDMGIMKRRENI